MAGLIATEYSEALFELAVETQKVREYKEQLIDMSQVIRENDELRQVLYSPRISKEDKKSILRQIFSYDAMVMNFVQLLVDRNHISSVSAIKDVFVTTANDYLNIEVAEVISATELKGEDLKEIKALLEKKTGKEIEIVNKVEPENIAGIRVKVKDIVYDNTVASKLEKMKQEINRISM
ncbi:MAG: ATP synthase F1 subunit delta [Erysipelotrichaceae bacterium]|nr:ATP synthase F1 subunit delta [Erysipelotrichaceae bacterium]